MALTQVQLQTLRNDIKVTKASTSFNGKTLLASWNGFDLQNIANYYNSIASPQVDLWKPDLKVEDMAKVLDMTTFVSLTVGQQNGYFALTKGTYVDATVSNVRTSFATIFGNGSANLTALSAIAKRPATNLESLFATSGVTTAYSEILSSSDLYNSLTA